MVATVSLLLPGLFVMGNRDKEKKAIYMCYYSMINRCYNPKATGYENYGAKGVTVCEEWRNNYKCFYSWAINNGWKFGLQLDKDIIPKKLGITQRVYCPEYCQFVTRKQNSREKVNSIKVVFEGEEHNLIDLCDLKGLDYSVVLQRYYKKWPIELCLTRPTGLGTNALPNPFKTKYNYSKNTQRKRIKSFSKTGPLGDSKYKGVRKHGGKWMARIGVDKKQILLGFYDTPEMAAIEYNKAALKYFGKEAYQNKVSK